jgi:hypothetical protein
VGRDLEARENFFWPSPARNAFLVTLNYQMRGRSAQARAQPEPSQKTEARHVPWDGHVQDFLGPKNPNLFRPGPNPAWPVKCSGLAAYHVLSMQALRSRHASAGIEASRRARIPSPPVETPVLVLWLNQVTLRFSAEPPQTQRADSGCEPLPCTGSDQRLRLAFLATLQPALDPAGHQVPRVKPTCLSTPRRPRKA